MQGRLLISMEMMTVASWSKFEIRNEDRQHQLHVTLSITGTQANTHAHWNTSMAAVFITKTSNSGKNNSRCDVMDMRPKSVVKPSNSVAKLIYVQFITCSTSSRFTTCKNYVAHPWLNSLTMQYKDLPTQFNPVFKTVVATTPLVYQLLCSHLIQHQILMKTHLSVDLQSKLRFLLISNAQNIECVVSSTVNDFSEVSLWRQWYRGWLGPALRFIHSASPDWWHILLTMRLTRRYC